MCRTVHAVLQTVICGIQMLVRVFMTVILMLENLIRMILQTLYNFISFLLQMISLIPICAVFLLTARLKCFMCGGGGPCPVNRGGACDCIMSAIAIIILFFIFRATGVLDKIFYSLGYIKTRSTQLRFVPTPGDITECSRNESDYTDETDTTTYSEPTFLYYEALSTAETLNENPTQEYILEADAESVSEPTEEKNTVLRNNFFFPKLLGRTENPSSNKNWTTILSNF
ncbi:uncharacterized protein LOC123692747 [Colias croceus]|uniref:uncharacterized protein LOC123692747 n=1 Tax=Colias crocea TaxID=72248 RepID=UPI001E280953|nr:uncharacterized protein LOC123692747 [Colias croceus]